MWLIMTGSYPNERRQQLGQRGRSVGREVRVEPLLQRGLEQAAGVLHAETWEVQRLREAAG